MSIATLMVSAGCQVVGPAGRGLIGELVGRDEAAHAQLDRVDAHLDRERADHALDEIDGFGDAGTSSGRHAAGRLVGVNGLDFHVGRLEVVGAAHDVEETGRELRGLSGANRRRRGPRSGPRAGR